MTDEQKQAYTRRISAANRAQLITIVFDMALDYMEEGAEALRAQNPEAAEASLKRARNCLADLLDSLDMQYELSVGLRELYLFANKQLILAEARRHTEPVAHARRVIEKLREAWLQIENTDESGAAFDNAQTVYAGLTYGKDALNESVADPASNRGLQA
ncbi:MAG: flagellar protein FliS [Lachnospiraceae bacterium]|nr:flagellar protein FliS [Lachnospiraceae bacterium]